MLRLEEIASKHTQDENPMPHHKMACRYEKT